MHYVLQEKQLIMQYTDIIIQIVKKDIVYIYIYISTLITRIVDHDEGSHGRFSYYLKFKWNLQYIKLSQYHIFHILNKEETIRSSGL